MPSEIHAIQRIKLKDLPAMAARFIEGAKAGTFIPITKHRAKALVHNPFASPDDVAMLLAEDNGRCLGYFGVMPVMLKDRGQLHKVHWLTTWAVDPSMVGKGLGSRLMEEALALDIDLAIVGSKPARRVSAKYGFQEVKPLDYVQLDFALAGRYNPISLLLRLFRKLISYVHFRLNIEPISQIFERIFEFIFGLFTRAILFSLVDRNTGDQLKGLRIERASPGVQPAKHEGPDTLTGFYRDSRIVNWMIAHPWVEWRSESEHLQYMFTDTRQFEIFAWQLSDAHGKNLGYIAFQCSWLRGRHVLKVLDHNIIEEKPELLLALAIYTARYCKASMIEGSPELVKPLEGTFLGRLLVQTRRRTCQVHPRSEDSPMAKALSHFEQSYCDGDMAFT